MKGKGKTISKQIIFFYFYLFDEFKIRKKKINRVMTHIEEIKHWNYYGGYTSEKESG